WRGTGRGVRIYVIDSGIRSTHHEFSNLGGRVAVSEGRSFVGDSQGTEDCLGHGTHVAGIAAGQTYGVAKEATLVPIRIFNCDGVPKATFVEGMDSAQKQWEKQGRPPALVNMSVQYKVNSNWQTPQAIKERRGVQNVVNRLVQ